MMTGAVHIRRVGGDTDHRNDLVVIEEPMEIRLVHGPATARREFKVSVTMRTPGHDFELAAGFLFTEGIVTTWKDILDIRYCEAVKEMEQGNVVKVALKEGITIDEKLLQRHFYATSSCGVCGKSSIDAVQGLSGECGILHPHLFTEEQIIGLQDKLTEAQTVFRYTGGIHAAALADRDGQFIYTREDIGRHNAVDKVIGAALAENRFPLEKYLLFVSGRAGFELLQKAARAGVGTFVSVGAPSSLAVDLAKRSGMTLIGFLRGQRFNIYNGNVKQQ